jgi:lipoate-protein ligase A
MERWRLIETFGASPELNMGLDEALLLSGERPTLRLYTWKPDTLSLGYFQRFDDVEQRTRAGALTRRITGGGAIHHENELTFSITCPLSHPLFRGEVASSYARVHAIVAAALSRIDVSARLRGDASLLSERPGSAMCFHRSSALDLCWQERKGVGSAQRRRQGRVLHHGSIKIGPSPLDLGVASLPASAESLALLLREAFCSELAIELEEHAPAGTEIERALELGAQRCSTEFLRRR